MKRVFLVTCVLVTTACSTAPVASSPTPSTPPPSTVSAAPSTPAAPDALNLRVSVSRDQATVGFATGDTFGSMSESGIDAYFANMQRQTGVHLARIDVKMSDVLPKYGATADWTRPDLVVKTLVGHNMWLHGIFDSPPDWVVDESCGARSWECAPSKNEQAYVDFAVNGARRYCSVLRTAEVLNEPTKAYWNHVPDYANLFSKVYAGIKQACPSARVEPGGTQAVGTSSPQEGYRPSDWYMNLCATPGYASVGQIASMHPYTWPATPADHNPEGQWSEVLITHEALNHCGIPGVEVDISEFGYPTAGGNRPATDERRPAWQDSQPVTSYRQAQFISDMFNGVSALRKTGVRIGEILIYTFQDRHTGGQDLEDNFGVVDSQGRPKVDPQGRNGPTAVEVIRQAASIG